MTDLSIDHLKHLLNQATPGPWERHPEKPRMLCNLERKFAVHAELAKGKGAEPEPEDVANTDLIALAPQLAQEVIRLREELRELRDQLKKKSEYYNKVELSTDPLDGMQLEDNHAENEISRILGDHNE